MSRFENLEFEGQPRKQAVHGQSPLKDHFYYLDEARQAFENGYFSQALRFYSKVLEFNPLDVTAWAGQSRMLIEMNEFKEANLWADKALERFPNSAELLAVKAVALARSGDLVGALALSDASMQELGEMPYLWLARADVLLARKEPRAEYCLEKALHLAPGDWFVTWLAARIRTFYQQFAMAAKLLQQALEFNAGHFRLWLDLGVCQQALGLYEASRKSLLRAKELQSDCPETDRALARLKSIGVLDRIAGWWQGLKQ